MKQIDKLKLKKNLLTGLISLSTFTVSGLATTMNVEAANENTAIESTYTTLPLSDADLVQRTSEVFNLDSTETSRIFEELTRGYTGYEWEHYNYLNGKQYDSKEEAIVSTMKDIYYNPTKYNLERQEIKSDEEYVVTEEPEQLVKKYANIYNINEATALSIVYAECGADVNSDNYLYNNNPAGLGPYMHFENKEIGVIYFIELLKTTYKCTAESGQEFFNDVVSMYCPGGEQHWIGLTLSFYNNVSEDYYFYAPELREVEYFKQPLCMKQNNLLEIDLNNERRKVLMENLNK